MSSTAWACVCLTWQRVHLCCGSQGPVMQTPKMPPVFVVQYYRSLFTTHHVVRERQRTPVFLHCLIKYTKTEQSFVWKWFKITTWCSFKIWARANATRSNMSFTRSLKMIRPASHERWPKSVLVCASFGELGGRWQAWNSELISTCIESYTITSIYSLRCISVVATKSCLPLVREWSI